MPRVIAGRCIMPSRKFRIVFVVAVVLGGLALIRPWQEDRRNEAAGERTASPLAGEAAISPARAAPVRLQLHAPSDVQVGERFEAIIDLEVSAPLRQLMFIVTYEKSRLSLVGWSMGVFALQ